MLIKSVSTNTVEGENQIEKILNRFQVGDDSVRPIVAEILQNVRDNGDQAVLDYTNKFDADNMPLSAQKVSAAELKEAYELVDENFLETLSKAIDRIHEFHEREMEDSWMLTREDGTIVGRMVRPVDAAGLYVPGGQGGSTPLVSSVLMNAIPAGIAGVNARVMVTPPDKDGKISPHLLVAAQEVGVTEIHKAGSAWGIAALAYGTETISKVDVIVGPGNKFVTEAKKQVSGFVKIDMIAGPSEVLIIADKTAKAKLVAADMLAQAEHDPLALSMVITTEEGMAEEIDLEIKKQLTDLSRAEIARKSLADRGIVIKVDNLEEAIALANDIAVEHLELMIADPWEQLPYIRHAGAIFLGSHTPESAGDYFAGPNHVLPTMGTARFSSALGVETFLKKSSIISYSQKALQQDGEHIKRLAELEGLTAHAASVEIRLKRQES